MKNERISIRIAEDEKADIQSIIEAMNKKHNELFLSKENVLSESDVIRILLQYGIRYYKETYLS